MQVVIILRLQFKKYGRCKTHIIEFLYKNYGIADIKFGQINLQFIEDFELFLKTNGRCCHNTAMKHIQTFKTVYKTAIAHGYSINDSFQKFKIRMHEVVRYYLTEQEIENMIELKLNGTGVSYAKDLFLFSCFTGLANVDLKNLSGRNLVLENKRLWIRTRRQKTNVKSNIPVLDFAIAIIKKRSPNFERVGSDEKIFDVISNQKINDHLKTLAKLARINKKLSFHIARHTFATTITLNNGVPIESVSSMLGHKHITTTQHYAKLLDKKLDEDMDKLSGRLTYNWILLDEFHKISSGLFLHDKLQLFPGLRL